MGQSPVTTFYIPFCVTSIRIKVHSQRDVTRLYSIKIKEEKYVYFFFNIPVRIINSRVVYKQNRGIPVSLRPINIKKINNIKHVENIVLVL